MQNLILDVQGKDKGRKKEGSMWKNRMKRGCKGPVKCKHEISQHACLTEPHAWSPQPIPQSS